MSNCIIVNNSALTQTGGGTVIANVTNCVIANNNAYENGGGVSGGTISSCVLWGNTAKNDSQYFFNMGGGIVNCAVQDAETDPTQITVSLSGDNMDPNAGPQFVRPTEFVGADSTRTAEILASDWSLLGGTAILPSQASFLDRQVQYPLVVINAKTTPIWSNQTLENSKLTATLVKKDGSRESVIPEWKDPTAPIATSGEYEFTVTLLDTMYKTYTGRAYVEVRKKNAPTIVSASVVGKDVVVTVKETKPVDLDPAKKSATGFALWRLDADDVNAEWQQVFAALDTQFLYDRSLLIPGKRYYYRVTAFGTATDNGSLCGESVPTASRLVKIPMVKPVIQGAPFPKPGFVRVYLSIPYYDPSLYQYAIHRVNPTTGKSMGMVCPWTASPNITFKAPKAFENNEIYLAAVAQHLSKKTPASGFSDSVKLTFGSFDDPVKPDTPFSPKVSPSDGVFYVAWENANSYFASVTRYTWSESKNKWIPNKKFPYAITDHFADPTAPFGVSVGYTVTFSYDGTAKYAGPESELRGDMLQVGAAQNFTATQGTLVNAVKLTWKMPKGGKYVKIMRNGKDVPLVNWKAMTSYTDKDVAPGPYEYHIQVSATPEDYGASDNSAIAFGYSALLAPTKVTATKGESPDYTRITWDRNPKQDTESVMGYAVARSTGTKVNGPDWEFVAFVDGWDAKEYDDRYAEPGVNYNYFVSTLFHLQMTTLWSKPGKGFRALSAPTTVYASKALDYDHIAVAWDPVPGAKYYRVYRGLTPDPKSAKPMTKRAITQCEYNDWDIELNPDSPYYYFVDATVTASYTNPSSKNSDEGFLCYEKPSTIEFYQGSVYDMITSDIAIGKKGSRAPDFTPISDKIKMSTITPTVSVHYIDLNTVNKTKQVARKLMMKSIPFSDGYRSNNYFEVWMPSHVRLYNATAYAKKGNQATREFLKDTSYEKGQLPWLEMQGRINTSKNDSGYAWREGEIKPAARTYRLLLSIEIWLPEFAYSGESPSIDEGYPWQELEGWGFGTTLPKVWLEYTHNERLYKIPLSVRIVSEGWIKGEPDEQTASRSLVQKDNGEAKIEYLIPATWRTNPPWKKITGSVDAPEFDIVVQSGTGMAVNKCRLDVYPK